MHDAWFYDTFVSDRNSAGVRGTLLCPVISDMSKGGWAYIFEIGYITSLKTENFVGEYHLGVISDYTSHESIGYNNGKYYNSNHFYWFINGFIEQSLLSDKRPLGLLAEGGYVPKYI